MEDELYENVAIVVTNIKESSGSLSYSIIMATLYITQKDVVGVFSGSM